MDYNVLREWDKWLRDPSHKQGIGALRRMNVDTGEPEYCCLGGLCEVTKKLFPEEFKGVEWILDGEENKWSFLGATGLPGHKVVGEVGLYDSNPSVVVPEQLLRKAINNQGDDPHRYGTNRRTCTELNDSLRFTFPEIADCIRETWPEAFTEEGSDNG